MKFGKHLERKIHAGWHKHYIDYKHLKNALKNVSPEEWLQIFQSELDKINAFFCQRESRICESFELLAKILGAKAKLEYSEREHLARFCRSLKNMRQYIILNYITVIKIGKKWNKKYFGMHQIDFVEFLLKQTFYTSQELAHVTVKIELLGMKVSPKEEIRVSNYLCPICLDVLFAPVILSCTHRFCWACLSNTAKTLTSCPICRKEQYLNPNNYGVDWALQEFLSEHFPKPIEEVIPRNPLGLNNPVPGKPKTLLIALDGLSPSDLQNSLHRLPHLAKLVEAGGFSHKVQVSSLSLAWVELLTGLRTVPPDFSCPTLFEMLNSLNPAAKTFSMTRAGVLSNICNRTHVKAHGHTELEEESVCVSDLSRALFQQGGASPDLFFIQIRAGEEANDLEGPQETSRKVDSQVGALLELVEGRYWHEEDWLVIVVAHPGSSIKSLDSGDIFMVARGSCVQVGEVKPHPQLVDLTSTVLSHMMGNSEKFQFHHLHGLPLPSPFCPNASETRASLSKKQIMFRMENPLQISLHLPQKKIRIVQFTDLHHYGDGSKVDLEGICMMDEICQSVKPDLVVLTGDILDGRHCKDFMKAMSSVVRPFQHRRIRWTYVPGNHDDENDRYTREDLLKVLQLPFCASRKATSFTHTIQLGPVQVYIIDSNGYLDQENSVYDFIHHEQIEWYKSIPKQGEVGLAFFHIPLCEFSTAKVMIGKNQEEPCTSPYNSGFFEHALAKKDISGIFVGHDHLNDYVSELEDVWLGYGRCSGFTSPSFYSDEEILNTLSLPRGGRVIEFDCESKIMSTWIETLQGMEKDTFIQKKISV